jgi:hypothetical protein
MNCLEVKLWKRKLIGSNINNFNKTATAKIFSDLKVKIEFSVIIIKKNDNNFTVYGWSLKWQSAWPSNIFIVGHIDFKEYFSNYLER